MTVKRALAILAIALYLLGFLAFIQKGEWVLGVAVLLMIWGAKIEMKYF